jgi:hypothetical protein
MVVVDPAGVVAGRKCSRRNIRLMDAGVVNVLEAISSLIPIMSKSKTQQYADLEPPS